MIELRAYINEKLGPLDFWLTQEIINRVITGYWRITGCNPDYDEHPLIRLSDFLDSDSLLRQWTIEAITASRLFEPRWATYAPKSKLLRAFELTKAERYAFQKECVSQAGPYKQRALEWLVGAEWLTPLFQSFKSQVEMWLAGRSKHKEPLSERQMTILLNACFKKYPHWIPNGPTEPKFVAVECRDPWTGEIITKLVPAAKAELEVKRAAYYQRVNQREA